MKIPERDWKTFRSMKDTLLDRACKNILKKVDMLIKKSGSQSHKAYLELWKFLKKEDNEISIMFDDLKRSNAIPKLAAQVRNGLITEDELMRFSEETRKSIRFINEL